MPTKHSLAAALKMARKARGLSQEAFSEVSSRTYLSTLERGMKSPTLSKIETICQVLDIHPLTLLTLSYVGSSEVELDRLMSRVRSEFTVLSDPPKK